mgnify:CR=1 FL=1
MNKRKYKAKCRALFEKAKTLGLELEFCPQSYDNNRLNCLWYGGQLAVIKVSDKLSIELSICGDVYAEFVDRKGNEMACVKDKNNSGAFTKYVSPYLKNDRQLLAAIDSNRLYLGNNNWIEYDGLLKKLASDKLYQFVDLGLICNNILDDDILVAIDSALDRYKDIAAEILAVAEGDEANAAGGGV